MSIRERLFHFDIGLEPLSLLSTVRYLVLNHEIPAYLMYAMGMGNALETAEEASTDKRSSHNRVEVSVLKNSVDQLVSTSSSGASAPPK